MVIVTDTVVIDGAKKQEIDWLRKKFGLELLREGLQGKVLLKAPEGVIREESWSSRRPGRLSSAATSRPHIRISFACSRKSSPPPRATNRFGTMTTQATRG